jgi:hypothetical protein
VRCSGLGQPCGSGKKSSKKSSTLEDLKTLQVFLQSRCEISKMADTADKGKKRKRHTDGSSKPSKKVAIEEDRKIKISLQDGDEWAPIIGMQEEFMAL